MIGLVMGAAVLAWIAGTAPATAQHAAIGADKCAKVCHKVEYQSWASSKHATTADKKAECETCHGNGADYSKLAIMKDPVKAKAAGLIAKPEQATCAKCHKPGEIKADMMTKVHAVKPQKS
jgi:hypothetical protein